ncbi:hypothetical protein NFI96_022101 [Prochilodus magdalenae]|nr:hypothetical protein NFI96_022101 [Prochilodus magdalenae]
MIEMSLEKETVLAGDGVGGVLSPPRSLLGRTKTPSPPATVPVGIGPPFMANMVLAELPPSEGDISEALRVKGESKPLQLKNGLQAQPGPQQPQRLGKRRFSMNAGFKHPGFSKRRRRANSDCEPVLPTNFLLGGNIFDPLNLNSLLDEEVNKALNAETPKSSPLPAKSREPVEILIPKDITDPLNLSGRGGDAHGGVLVSPMKSGGRRRHRNRHHGGANGGQLDPADSERSKGDEGVKQLFPVQHVEAQAGALPEPPREGALLLDLQPVEESPRPYELNTSINCRDEVVPPILPRRRSNTSTNSAPPTQTGSSNSTSSAQPSKHRKRRRTISRSERLSITPTPTTKQPSGETGRSQTFHTPIVGGAAGSHRAGSRQAARNRQKPQRKYQYGTYSHYYGYQTPALNRDPRLAVFRPEWFRGKKVLDIGCNVGHLTLAIAKHWSPAHILGLDIDGRLVHAARQNLRHFLSELQRQEVQRGSSAWGEVSRQGRRDDQPEEEKTESSRETEETQEREEAQEAGTCEGQPGGRAHELIPLMKLQLEMLRSFPISFRLCRGPVSAPPLQPHTPGVFPNNVSFMKVRPESGCVRTGASSLSASLGLSDLCLVGSSAAYGSPWRADQDEPRKAERKGSSAARTQPGVYPVCVCTLCVCVCVPCVCVCTLVYPVCVLCCGDYMGNYVPESEGGVMSQRAEYDVILCLGVTKWVHLNWGDVGLQWLFKRAYRHLTAGGVLILEPQPWSSYSKRKRLTETTFRNYNTIRLRPDQFSTYLTSEVGFTSYELISTPNGCPKGLQRPIYLFHKGPSRK